MKLKPVKKVVKTEEPKETRKTRKKGENTLPPDDYTPLFPPIRFLVRETPSRHGGVVKQYFELSVKRFDDDESPVCLWIQMYQESDFYTGYLKGKTVYLPLKSLNTMLEGIEDVFNEVDERGIV